MTSFIRISDIPHDELHLLPIIDLRLQNRRDRSRLKSPANAPDEREAADDTQKGKAQQAEAAPAEASPAAGGQFVTDWQLHDEPHSRARFPFNGEACDEDENRGAADPIDALYIELGGEGAA